MSFKYIIEILNITIEMVENIQTATLCWMQRVCSLLVIVQSVCSKHCLHANDTQELSRHGYRQRYGPGRALGTLNISWKDTMKK